MIWLSAIALAATSDLCDGIDDDGDGSYDEDASFISLWEDLDGDEYGAGVEYSGCEAVDANAGPGVYYVQDPYDGQPDLVVAGYVPDDGDCIDFNSGVSPDAAEVCDDIDNDCNLVVDDAVDGGNEWFTDEDGDGYGSGDGVYACRPPDQFAVPADGDCDDSNAEINPGADEVCDDGVDDNCNGVLDDCPGEATTGDALSDGDKDEGCGCAGAPGTSPGLFAGLLLSVLLRRREWPR